MKLRIEQDPKAPNPREGRRAYGKIVHWHPRRNLGQRVADREGARTAMPPGSVWLPISLFDHYCVRLWVGILPHWSEPRGGDSGHVGFIYATPEDIEKYFKNGDANDPELRRKVRRCLGDQIRKFDQFLRGDVWGVVVESDSGELIEERRGIFGREFAEEIGQEALERAEQNVDLFIK